MILTYNTIKEISMSQDMHTVYVEPDLDNPGYFKSCNTLYMRQGSVFKSVEGHTYAIQFFNGINGNFAVFPPAIPGVPVFNGDRMILEEKPYFIGGKPLTVNSEWLQFSKRSSDKLPLIWYVTNSVEDYGSEQNNLISCNNVLLYFLDQTDEDRWSTEQHYTDTIPRMNNLMRRFKDIIDKNSKYIRKSFDARPWERFGKKDKNGSTEKIINEDLSGYEVLINFDIKGCVNC